LSDKIKNNPISFRLNDEQIKRLDEIADSHDIQRSTMASNIIVNYLNDSIDELLINHISYPRPIMKKLFSTLDKNQLNYIIIQNNEYNQGIIKSALQTYPPEKILEFIKKWFKKSGCEVNITSFRLVKSLEIHHELEENWSILTCATMVFILGELDFEVRRTFIENDWFKIEYV